jgi:hypothetical protein
MRHDLPKVAPISEAYPHIVLHNLTTKIGQRVGAILQHLFPVPKPDTRRVISFVNSDDFISFRHHVYTKEKADVHLMEAGPRFELRLYQVRTPKQPAAARAHPPHAPPLPFPHRIVDADRPPSPRRHADQIGYHRSDGGGE